MKRELRDKWLTALRSGEYKQQVGYLATDQGHCCLGVLAEIADCEIVSNVVEDSDNPTLDIDNKVITGVKSVVGSSWGETYLEDQELPHSIAEELGIVKYLGELMIKNDGDYNFETHKYEGRQTFAQIADWIEANIPVED